MTVKTWEKLDPSLGKIFGKQVIPPIRNHVKEQLSGWYEKLQKHNLQNYLVIHAIFQVLGVVMVTRL